MFATKRLQFAFRPFGGSVTILMHAWSNAIGKTLVGDDESHNRKSGCGLSSATFSNSFSNSGNQEEDKWQFASSAQAPVFAASRISFVAFGACPCPSEMVDHCRFLAAASAARRGVGSTPGVRIKRSGTSAWDSSNTAPRSNGGGSTNLLSSFWETNTPIAGRARSMRKHLTTSIFCCGPSLASHSPGSGSFSGSPNENHFFQSLKVCSNER
mmetsp:Transcript_16730/g.41428  ORF Transcript_16730/g.41428 Transcript_16730/m.41428 type:complete len:212 (+) Transcript_16730:1892-2527(+)